MDIHTDSPWDGFAPATLEFCETLLNGWIRQPANTWSSLGFTAIGIYLWFITPSHKSWLRVLSIGSTLVGLTSAMFHASMTFAAQFFDVSSMFMTAGMLVILNSIRLGWINTRLIYISLFLLQALAMAIMLAFKESSGEIIFAVMIAFIVLSEIHLIQSQRPGIFVYRWWIASALTYASATLVWILDIRKIWCEPDNHWFNGHAAWHLLNGLVIYCLYRFYEEIFKTPISTSEIKERSN